MTNKESVALWGQFLQNAYVGNINLGYKKSSNSFENISPCVVSLARASVSTGF